MKEEPHGLDVPAHSRNVQGGLTILAPLHDICSCRKQVSNRRAVTLASSIYERPTRTILGLLSLVGATSTAKERHNNKPSISKRHASRNARAEEKKAEAPPQLKAAVAEPAAAQAAKAVVAGA